MTGDISPHRRATSRPEREMSSAGEGVTRRGRSREKTPSVFRCLRWHRPRKSRGRTQDAFMESNMKRFRFFRHFILAFAATAIAALPVPAQAVEDDSSSSYDTAYAHPAESADSGYRTDDPRAGRIGYAH